MASPQAQTHTASPTSPISPTSPLGLTHNDPFAAQRKDPINSNPFTSKTQGPINIPTPTTPNATLNTHSGSPNQDRRLSSDEWGSLIFPLHRRFSHPNSSPLLLPSFPSSSPSPFTLPHSSHPPTSKCPLSSISSLSSPLLPTSFPVNIANNTNTTYPSFLFRRIQNTSIPLSKT
ncbi:hypothetical protein SS1G_08582 [Sclerotinia sclerotiorum 1980 UF-70]|uniref:Uncharacterized protein n=1 Tax=Sclerotinia sclerotiorum (strain ATCC 18683 / 1980 / Ss-1) TaxID=665079 RepID=A7ETC7_SCLS1|nr:hypothetical protein SS1G_08582 [Sclerotinia sclerotiorum 1980 UF-70]EDN92719.1 hypothetical protein SS1G_08582 [Sclerotinia sclerotiorum 1980 UF-70]